MSASSPKSASKPLPRKERERLARRREIVQAARIVFAEKGFDKATLEEIAERAEFGKGTLYNYFDNKESLFAAAMEDLFDDVESIAAEASSQTGAVRDCFGEYARRMIEYYHAHYAFCRMMMREWVRPDTEKPEEQIDIVRAKAQTVADPLARILRAAMRHKEVRKADPKVLAMIFIGLVHHYFMHHLTQYPKSEKDLTAQVDLIVSVFFDGITRTAHGGKR
jgi:AcrR family transcriptional regulator